MTIYGYTRVNSQGDRTGRESEVLLFPDDRKQRDRVMYQDYSDSFDAMAAECGFKINEDDGTPHDENDEPKMTENEFLEALMDSKDQNQDIFGHIQASDYHVQYEPFTQTL